MMYEVGDKIVVKQTNEDGKVVEIINEQMIMIEVRGVRFPAYADQVEYPYFKMFTQKIVPAKKKIFVDDVKKEKHIRKKTGDGVHLQFIPVMDKDVFDDEVVDKLKIYLVNQNEEEYLFDYHLYFGNEDNFDHKNTLHPLSEFYLHDINFEDISDNPRFAFEFSLKEPQKKKAPYFEAGLKVTGKKIFKRVEELQLKNEASFSYELFTVYPDKMIEDSVDLSSLGTAGFRVYDAAKGKNYLPPARSVIDIHIEKITDSYKHLNNFEILTMQLNEFEKYYELAVLHHLKEFTVIHGVGEGKLKEEIHEILKLKKEVKSFVNQYHHLYGYGATEIYFK